jgi:hypothetical protein
VKRRKKNEIRIKGWNGVKVKVKIKLSLSTSRTFIGGAEV